MDKKELRKEVLARRDGLSQQDRQAKSIQIAEKVIEQEVFQRSDVILLYASAKSEVDTMKIFHEAKWLNKNIYCPRVIGKEMEFYLVDETTEFETSAYGIREPQIDETKRFVPKEQNRILVLMPGVVFDKTGRRVGYGGGYYDKYLSCLDGVVPSENVYKVAIAFEVQMVKPGVIEKQPHDIQPDWIITECGVYTVGKGRLDGKFL